MSENDTLMSLHVCSRKTFIMILDVNLVELGSFALITPEGQYLNMS